MTRLIIESDTDLKLPLDQICLLFQEIASGAAIAAFKSDANKYSLIKGRFVEKQCSDIFIKSSHFLAISQLILIVLQHITVSSDGV